MMAEYHRLSEQKYSEADYLFQTIEMAKSDEEFDVELCTTPPSSSAPLHHPESTGDMYDVELVPQEPSIFSWKVVKRRQRPHRRYTVSHGGGAPPAPPSTPTSLTANTTPVPSPSPTAASSLNGLSHNGHHVVNGNGNPAATLVADDEPLSSLLYILDYAPKYKKKLKEQQRTDAELAELFNIITITSSGNSSSSGGGGGGGASASSNNTNALLDAHSVMKFPPERGISANSRVIRKYDTTTKIFKIHRNPKEFFRDAAARNGLVADDAGEDSVSAPEYDDEREGDDGDGEDAELEERRRMRRLARLKFVNALRSRLPKTKRQRRLAKFLRSEHQERMDAMMENFDAAMNMNDA